jgi:hypothetical protein
LKTLFGVFFEAAMNHALQSLRSVLRQLRNARRIFIQDGRHGIGGSRSLESAGASQHLVENRSESKDVGAMVDRLPSYLFGSHVASGAQHDAGLGCGCDSGTGRVDLVLRLCQFGETEIQNLDPAVLGDEEVFGFQVAVNDAFFVGGCDAMGDLNSVVDGLAHG